MYVIFVFWNFFSPIILGWWGNVFGSENFENFWPHMGFPPKLFFEIHDFLVITLIGDASWSVHWPQGVYILNIVWTCVDWWNRWNSNLFEMGFKYKSEMFHHVSDILGSKSRKSDNFVKFPYIVMSPYTRRTTEGNDLIE